MATGNIKLLKDFRVANGSVNSYSDESVNGLLMLDNNVEESENPENVLLEDLDSYWDDINDRLTISRMVGNSVIRGLVNAIEDEAAEKIAQKELELGRLKETLDLYHVGSDESKSFRSPGMQHEPGSVKHGSYSSPPDVLFDYDRIGESLRSLKNAAKEQLKNVRKEIDRIRGGSSLRRIGSGSEIMGLGGILQDKVSDIKWMDVDRALDSLRTTVETIYKNVDNVVDLSKESLCQWKQEKEFQRKIEDMVIMNCIQSLKEEFQERVWDQSAQFYENESTNWVEKIKEISSLRQELNAISKSLSVSGIGHVTPHGLMAIGDEWDTNKRTDHLHRKISGNHVTSSTSLWEGNGKHDESVIAKPENSDFNQLGHMSKEELLTYFRTVMTKMKRNHEHVVQEMTEEYFSLKREYLKERGPSLPIKKDKGFDVLRKKIPEVILKLDDILVENEKLPTFSKNAEGLSSSKDKLESLLSENHHLKSLLDDKEREIKCLSSQVSDTSEIMLQHSLAEAYGFEDSYLESVIMQELSGVIFREAVKEAEVKLNDLILKYDNETEIRVSVKKDALEKERALRLEVAENERLKEETLFLSSLMEEKENLVNEAASALMKEKERFDSVSRELENLRDETSRQQTLISESLKEFDDTMRNLVEAEVQIELYKVEVHELKQMLEFALKELRETNEEKRMLLCVNQEKQHLLSLVEAEEREHRNQMQSLIIFIKGLSEQLFDFECRVMDDIQRNNSRMDSLSCQSKALIQNANIIKTSRLICKQKLERRCSDLQKAEIEVDLLGDEVDALLGLLEKIYIALDHYSPVLSHYSGIIEILKLVRRALSGESTKSL